MATCVVNIRTALTYQRLNWEQVQSAIKLDLSGLQCWFTKNRLRLRLVQIKPTITYKYSQERLNETLISAWDVIQRVVRDGTAKTVFTIYMFLIVTESSNTEPNNIKS